MSQKFENYIEEDNVHGKIQDVKSFFELLRYAKRFRLRFVWALSLIFFGVSVGTYGARMTGTVVELMIKKDWNQASAYALFVVLAETLVLYLLWVGKKIIAEIALLVILEIRKKIFAHINRLPISYYDKQPQGRIVTRITHDVEGIEDFFTSVLSKMISATGTFVVVVIAMLKTDFVLGLIVAIGILPAVVSIFGFKSRIRSFNREISKRASACNARLSEYINGLDVIRSFGVEKWAKDKYDEVLNDHLSTTYRGNFFFAIIRPATSFLCDLPLVLVMTVGGYFAFTGRMEIGILVAFFRYGERFSYPIMALTREMHIIQQAFTSAERVATFLNAIDEDTAFGVANKIFDREVKGDVLFENVEMQYKENTPVLNGVTFNIKSGEKVGFVGKTGSGKSSTVSLISRLYDFQKGRVLIDGIDIREINRDFLRSKIGFVSQDVVIFKGTLRDNLSCGQLFADDEIIVACEKTGLSLVMNDRHMKLSSRVLDYGNNLSSGERQLISLTRILLTDPSILILDEATANIDPHFEKIIHNAIDLIMRGRTCLIIAHRLATLDHVDRILVFKDGKIVEDGDYQTLINKAGYFSDLHSYGSAPVLC